SYGDSIRILKNRNDKLEFPSIFGLLSAFECTSQQSLDAEAILASQALAKHGGHADKRAIILVFTDGYSARDDMLLHVLAKADSAGDLVLGIGVGEEEQ